LGLPFVFFSRVRKFISLHFQLAYSHGTFVVKCMDSHRRRHSVDPKKWAQQMPAHSCHVKYGSGAFLPEQERYSGWNGRGSYFPARDKNVRTPAVWYEGNHAINDHQAMIIKNKSLLCSRIWGRLDIIKLCFMLESWYICYCVCKICKEQSM
jgi:hypothetical protein